MGKFKVSENKRLYGVWSAMKQRCYYKDKQGYKYYGGRGIKVCEEWKNSFSSFAEWAFKNGYDEKAKPYECTLDRIDVDGDYCPENCRWANMNIQNSNRRKYEGKLYEYNGEKHTIKDWAKILNTCYHTLICRLSQYNWDFKKAVETPIRKSGKYYGKTD